MSSEFPQQAGISATERNAERRKPLETRRFLEQPSPTGTAGEQFKSPLRHQNRSLRFRGP